MPHRRRYSVTILRFASALSIVLAAARVTNAADAAHHPVIPGFERFHHESASGQEAARGGRLLINELNCRSCHTDLDAIHRSLPPRRAPVLTDVGGRVTPEFLGAFIANPAKFKPGTTMPAMFTGLSESERIRKITAITHFLASTGSPLQTPPNMASAKRGQELFHRIGCVACHDRRTDGSTTTLATSVPLGDPAAKYTINSLTAFLRDPHKVRRSGRMPNLNLSDTEARDIASFFLKDIDIEPNLTYRYYEGHWQKLPDFSELTPKTTGGASGFDLGVSPRKDSFGLRFEGFLHIERGGNYIFHLGSDDGSRLSIDGETVVDVDGIHPHSVRSGNIDLEAGAHPIVVDYFEAGGEETLTVEYQGKGINRQPLSGAVTATPDKPEQRSGFQVDDQLVSEGRKLFASVGCASCHEMKVDDELVRSSLKVTPIDRSKTNAGCLAPERAAGAPHFGLTPSQSTGIAAALHSSDTVDLPPSAIVADTMATLNCYACHSRDKRGGVERARDELFATRIREMGDEGRIPPALDGVGDKLNTDWLKHVMANGANDRPYMLARMPRFGLDNVGKLIDAFTAADAKTETEEVVFALPEHRVKSAGRLMVGDQGLSCIKCHYFDRHKATGIQAMDLTTMTRRLRHDWFRRYMINPQVYRSGTRMPSAWPNGRSVLPKVLDGNTDQQLVALWNYLADGKQAPIPAGLVAGVIELKPDRRPIIYRNFIEGVSPRAIAVGYPEKAHLAFDAEQFSLALIWHGAFIDASKHWVGRGPGNQTPLGDHVFSLVRGAPFARLSVPDESWPAESPRESGYRFNGYRLDSDGRPTFLYSFGDITVEDFPRPVPGDPDASFERVLTLLTETTSQPLWFRAAAGASIEEQSDGWFIVDGAVRMQIESNNQPTIRTSNGRFELLVRIPYDGRQARIIQRFVW